MFLNSMGKSKHRLTTIIFERMTKPKDGKNRFASRIETTHRDSWLVFNIWVTTGQILKSTTKFDPDTRLLIEQIKESIKKTKPDIFFLNGFSALTFLVLKAVHELDIPVVTTHHGIWLKEYMALKSLVKKNTIKYRKELERDTVRYATKNIFLSNLSLKEFEKHLIKVPKNQLEFIRIPYNPVFVHKTMPKQHHTKNLKLLMVGRWDGVKNHEAYLALAKRAKQLKLPWTFYSVCNLYDYPHYNKIRKDYEKYIKVLPGMGPEALKNVYLDCDITVLPSHFDVYPGVVTESILQNRPSVISKNVGWVDEFKKHGIEHWITDFTNPDKAIAKIKQVSQEQVPKSLYNDILVNNNPALIFKQYFKLFERMKKWT